MVAMISIYMGGMIVTWSVVDVTDQDEASVLFPRQIPKIAHLPVEFRYVQLNKYHNTQSSINVLTFGFNRIHGPLLQIENGVLRLKQGCSMCLQVLGDLILCGGRV